MEILKTGLWFLQRPRFWAHARELALRRVLRNRDSAQCAAAAEKWARERAVSVEEALCKVGLKVREGGVPILPADVLKEARERSSRSGVAMGGPGDINFLFAATVLSGAERVVETGVAYGWSTLAILAALAGRSEARLVSVDMPYPKRGNEPFVGIVVTERLRNNWTLIRQPDRNGLVKAIAEHSGTIDLCHYDSDKSWRGREFAYPILWNALRSKGIFVSDDIQDNFAFRDFAEQQGIEPAITQYEGKYVGIMCKP